MRDAENNESIEAKSSQEHKGNEPLEFSFLLVKPNAVKTGLTGTIRQELVKAGFDIVNEKDLRINRFGGEVLYHSLGNKKGPVVDHIVSGESHVFVVVGLDAIRKLRELQGNTEWKDRPAKGLRGKYATDHIQNSVHCPDSYKEAVDEFNLVFPNIRDEMLKTQLADELHGFLNNQEAIDKSKRYLSAYAV